MPSSQRRPDPFGPIETIVSFLLFVLVAFLLLFAVIGVVGVVVDGRADISIATIGDPTACALVSNEAVPSSTGVSQRDIRRDVGSVIAEEVRVCIDDPTLFQKTASALQPVGDLVFGVGSLVLLRAAIRVGRRSGPFTVAFARRVQRLGWFMLVMSALWPFLAAAGRGVVLDAVVPRQTWTYPLFQPGVSVALVVVSFGVLTTARLLRRAVLLQEEADQTV
ncbi:DUF2975 domain-containing protein [Nocardioides sp. SYSU DS0663]|uniref:DUF2975 domain-containing protein n=1 Tax=Nocardioides sp. SYSU DS0663 TaxID=3416445 RepID=UPI003F4BBD89